MCFWLFRTYSTREYFVFSKKFDEQFELSYATLWSFSLVFKIKSCSECKNFKIGSCFTLLLFKFAHWPIGVSFYFLFEYVNFKL